MDVRRPASKPRVLKLNKQVPVEGDGKRGVGQGAGHEEAREAGDVCTLVAQGLCVCVRACVHVCVCVRAYMRACVRACVRTCVCGTGILTLSQVL